MADQINMIESPQITIYYQRSTSNSSFVDMANYLESIGIKNNRFMLALLDPDLAGIDPHDPNLPIHMKRKVLMECVNNFWYYLREVVRVPAMGEPSKFILNRGNMAFLWLAIMNINTIQIQPRQTGKTIGAAAFYTYVYNFRTTNTQISLLNKEFKDSKDNLARIRAIRDLLPSYLRFDAVFSEVNGKKVKVPNTATYIENAFNHNKLRTYAKARNELSAANLLRGQTFPLLWADEFAFIPFMKTIYGNMIPAMSKATEIAKKNNVPYGILYTTTPGFLTTDEGKYAFTTINNATKWNEAWYDLNYFQIKEIIESNRLSNFVFIEYNYAQLGLDENWLYERCKEMSWDWPLIRREYLLKWEEESENNPFTKEELDTIQKYCKEPKKTVLIFGKYELKIFEEIPLKANLVPKYPPIIGVDPSGGVSRDFSSIVIIDSNTTRVFAELVCNTVSLIDLARIIEYIVLNMMPNAVVNIDRTGGWGLSVIAKLKETKVKKNLYYEMKDKIVEEVMQHGRIVRMSRRTKVYGLTYTHDIRNQLIELLKERVSLHKDKFISPTIYKELTGLEIKKNGKVDHSELTHDDTVMAYLLSLWVWYNGRNLKDIYGIEKTHILTEDSVDDIVDLETGPKSMADMSKSLLSINRMSDMNQAKTELDLQQSQKAQGMMFSDFAKQQQKKEEEHLKFMLKQDHIRQAYARYYGVPVEAVDSNVGTSSYDETNYTMPKSLFTDFNKSVDEMEQDSIYLNLSQEEYYNRNARNYYEDESMH